MKYPIVLKQFHEGLQLFIPDPSLLKQTYNQICLTEKDTLFPYWAKVWPSSIALSSFLLEYPTLINHKKVLEIGAGIGLPSFSIAHQVSSITITDYANDAIELLQKNSDQIDNPNVHILYADWNKFPDSINADVVLLSDTNYEPSQFESLLILIKQFLSKGSTVIIASPMRITTNAFIIQLDTHIIQREIIKVNNHDELISIALFVLKE